MYPSIPDIPGTLHVSGHNAQGDEGGPDEAGYFPLRHKE